MKRLILAAMVAGGWALPAEGQVARTAEGAAMRSVRVEAKRPPAEPDAGAEAEVARASRQLPLPLRKEIWAGLSRAATLSAYETRHRSLGRVDPAWAHRSALDGEEPFRLQLSYQAALEGAARPLLERYEIGEDQRDAIWEEGVAKGWPTPFVPDPGAHVSAEEAIKAEVSAGTCSLNAIGGRAPARARRR